MRRLTFAFLGPFLSACLVAAAGGKEKAPTVYKIASPPKPDFSALGWLVGEWSGKVGIKAPTGQVHFSAAYDLEQRFMVLREELWFQQTKAAPATRESWMGILSPGSSGKNWLLRVYSNFGFITRYRVTADGSEIHFDFEGGENSPQGWVFRRTIQRVSDTDFSETVQAAPPGREFFDYYSAQLTRLSTNKPSPGAAPPPDKQQPSPGH
jgi:hypothetical protein